MTPERSKYLTGAQKFPPRTGPDPSDDFSQDAAANKKPEGMGLTEPDDSGAPGTVDQRPRWEGPPENRPRGYLPAKDDPSEDRDAAGENLKDPEKRELGDALKHKKD